MLLEARNAIKMFLPTLLLILALCSSLVPELRGDEDSVSTKKATELGADDDIVHLSISGVIIKRGYDFQLHYALTKDGYYIHLIRLINPFLGKQQPPKRPVIFNHGLLESSSLWVVNSKGVRPQNKIGHCEELPISVELAKNETEFLNGPMLLANHGYDVWLMSMRGTDFSMYHKTMDTSAPEFWDYSLDNFAQDDVPSVVNYVRRHTGHKKVGYVGHSQATFSVFGLLASKPHYADIIEPVFAVAPVAYMHHLTSLAKPMFLNELQTPDLHGSLPPIAREVRARFAKYCNKKSGLATRYICDTMDTIIGGKGEGSAKPFLSFFPFHTSHKVMRHFGQIISKKKFTMYDHGPEENTRRYGTSEAPLYRVEKIRSKSISLFWTRTDSLSDPRDVDRFKSELAVSLYRDVFIDREFNHFDLITHPDARFLVFAPILEILEEFEKRAGVCRVNDFGEQLRESLSFGALQE